MINNARSRRWAVGGVAAAATLSLATGVNAAQAATAVAVWHMDETSGTKMVDSSSSGGTTNGTTHNVQLGVDGVDGHGYEFNGKSSYVSVASTSALNPGSDDVTIGISFKTTSLPKKADWDLIRKGYYGTSGGEWKVELQPSGQASCGFKGSAGYRFLKAGPKTLADGKWHSVTCTKTSSGIKLKVDGKSFSKSGKVGSISNSKPVVIGAYPGKEFFKGTLDEATIDIG